MKTAVCALVVCAATAWPARAGEWAGSANGSVATRVQAYALDESALLHPMLVIEPVRISNEASLQAAFGDGQHLHLSADIAAIARVVPQGCGAEDRSLACLVVNELYAEWRPWQPLRLLAGRYRASWGAATTWQPIEALNPRPDVTEPISQRLGVWMALVEGTLFDATATLMVAPEIEHAAIGVPTSLAPLYGTAAARLAWSGWGADVGAVGYWDYGLGKLSGGGTASWALLDGLTLHGQGLVHERRPLGTGALEEGSCPGLRDIGIPLREVLDFSANVGARYDFSDGTILGAEYVHNGDGVTAPDFLTTVTTVQLIKQQCPNARIAASDVAKEGRPTSFGNTLLGRNYVVLTGVRPNVFEWRGLEDTSLLATVLFGVDDLTVLASARAAYTLRQSTTFRLGVLVPLGFPISQLGILPFDGSVVGEIQASF